MDWIKKNKDILFGLFIFGITLYLIKPYKYNFAINDDWDFYLHVKYFLDGIYVKNAFIDSAFILQGFIATLWAKIFGLSFINLRLLTLVFLAIFLSGVYVFSDNYISNQKKKVFLLLTIIFNPLILISSLSFMTEIYFLAFFIWSLVFFLKYVETRRLSSLIKFSLLTGASLLVRQFGFVLLVSYALGLIILFFKERNKKLLIDLVTFIAVFGVFFLVLLVFPKVPSRIVDDVGFAKHTLKLFSTIEDLRESLYVIPFVFVYLSYFLIPVQFIHRYSLKLKESLPLILVGFLIATILYRFDIFPIGNVIYIERLFSKTDYISVMTLFDNKVFKVALSVLLGVNFSFLLYKTIKASKVYEGLIYKPFTLVYTSLCILMFIVAFVAQGSFERYFANFFVLTTIFYFINNTRDDLSWKAFLPAFSILWIISTFLVWDFFSSEGLKWKLAEKIQPQISDTENIHLSPTYLRFSHSTKQKDPYKLQVNRREKNFRCQIQRLYRGGDSDFYKTLSSIEKSKQIRKYLKNPDIYKGKTSVGFRDINYYEYRIVLQEEYFTPLNMFFNRKSYIAVFCFNEGKN